MKKFYTLFTLFATMLLLPALAQAQVQTLTLTTAKSAGATLTFTVNRTPGDLLVDWGDGNFVAYTTTKEPLRDIAGTLAGKTVTVKGDNNLNTLICEGQELTEVDFTNAPNLKSVYLSHNALTALVVKPLGNNLLDLDCSHNALNSVAITVANNPNLETLNVSNNTLGSINGSTATTSYTGAFTKLQYLNISGNGRIKQASVSSCNELDYLDCSGNVMTKLILPTNGRLTTLDAAGNKLTTLDVTPYTNLLQLDVTGNQLTTLDLNKTKVIKDLFAADNELTSIGFATRASRDTFNICDVRNNRVHFNGLPRSTSKVRYLNVMPQRPFPLTEEMGFKKGSVEVDGVTYTTKYVTQNPSYDTRTNTDYIVTLTPLRMDGNQSANNVITFLDASTPDSTVLSQYYARTKTGDYTINSQTNEYTFLSEVPHIVIRLTNTKYSKYTFYSEEFSINEPSVTALETVALDGTPRSAKAVYDLQGRKVANPASGIYIIGGRKVFIK